MILIFLGCSSISSRKKNIPSSKCDDLFSSCSKVDSVSNCKELFNENPRIDWTNRIIRLEGPLDSTEVDILRKKEIVFAEQGNISLADSFWWFIEGHEYSGSQGVIGIKQCKVIGKLDYYFWIKEMF